MKTNNILKLEIDNKTKHLEKHLRSFANVFETIELPLNFVLRMATIPNDFNALGNLK